MDIKKLTIIIVALLMLSACSFVEGIPKDEVVEEEPVDEEPEVVVDIENESEAPLELEVKKINTTPEPEVEEEPDEPEINITPQGRIVDVIVENRVVTPQVVKINVGDSVRWIIKDKVSVKFSGSYIKPPSLYFGDEYVLKFERPGIFPYTNEYLSGMSGEIHVKEVTLTIQEPVEEEPEGLHFVKIQNYEYVPRTITVKKGEIVIWEAFDMTAQTVDGAGFSSGPLRRGDKFFHTFNLTGKFPYGSVFRQNMIGTVVVEE